MKTFFFTFLFLATTLLGFSQLTVSLPTIGTNPGTVISVPVTLNGASSSGTPISAADIRINFNPAVLTYSGIVNFNPSMPSNQWFFSGSNTTGLVSANWLEPSLLTLAIPDNSVLYEIQFTYLGGNSALNFSFTEFTDASYNVIPTNTVLGSVGPDSKTLNLKCYLEGLYNPATGLMNQAQGDAGAQFAASIADQVTVELHDATFPYSTAITLNDINLYVDGNITINSIPGTISGSYFIVVKHRNSIETWSASDVSFSASSVSYDFSVANSQAFGNNLRPVTGGSYAIYGGDVSQDGVIDGTDMASVDNASTAITMGYVNSDANGDGVVDGTDMAMIDNNSTAVITVVKP